jgi:EmrB/QacA subfamily drug resistance transporter
MMAIFMAAVEVTIVATAMPTIVARLGGSHLFSWVFAAYLLTQAVTTPIYGRLADIYGRKRVFFAGSSIFLVGSAACGLTWSMTSLVVFRTLQGLGAGCIQSVSTTIVGDIYPPTQRARVQGWLSGVWAVAAVLGPVLGAFIVQHLHWAFVFWINLPIGIVTIALLAMFLHETPQPKQHSIDTIGSVLLMFGLGAVMTALVQVQSLGVMTAGSLAGVGLVALVGLAFQERRTAEPIVPIALLRNRAVAVGSLGGLIIGGLLMCVVAFVPTYVQAVMGRTPTVAGTVVAALSVAWSAGSIASGRLMGALSFRTTGVIGAAALIGGTAVLILLATGDGLGWLSAGAILIGIGMGFTNLVFLLVQASVGWNERGVATAAILFARTLGQAIGAALGGAILNIGLAMRAPGITDALDRLLQPDLRAALGAGLMQHLIGALSASVGDIYLVAGALALAAFAVASLLPRDLHLAKPAAAKP